MNACAIQGRQIKTRSRCMGIRPVGLGNDSAPISGDHLFWHGIGRFSRLTHRPTIPAARRPLSLSNPRQKSVIGILLPPIRDRRNSSSRAAGNSGQVLGLGRIFFSNDELLELVVFERAGAFHSGRPQFLRTARHIRQDRSELSEPHRRALSSSARCLPKVAKGEKHGVPEIRAFGVSNER